MALPSGKRHDAAAPLSYMRNLHYVFRDLIVSL